MGDLPVVFCAIDTPDSVRALELARLMARAKCGVKLGLEFFCAHGIEGVGKIRQAEPDLALFLDLKFHDIPNTVAGAVRSVMTLAPQFMTVHASGGCDMMRAAEDAARDEAVKLGLSMPRMLGVTVLTSLNSAVLEDVGQDHVVEHQVLRLARLTQEAGLAGIVCSGSDASSIRASLGPDFVLMVPGIRPQGSAAGDQKRVMTPADAMRAGATHLVIGRPITRAEDPAAAVAAILGELDPEHLPD